MFVRRSRALALLAVLAFVACAKTSTPQATGGAPSLSIGSVPKSAGGNVVTIPVTVQGIEIVKADGDTSGKTGHFHVFVDSDPVAAGTTIEKKRGIVHSADNPIKVFGLEPGSHTFTVVLGNGAHQRIGTMQDEVTVDVKGPSVQGSAPATVESGDDYTIALKSEGIDVVPPGGGMREGTAESPGATTVKGHYVVLIDPATPPQAGTVMPQGEEGKVYHTGESSVSVPDLAKGEHIAWIVGVDESHKALEPAVMDKLTVTVM